MIKNEKILRDNLANWGESFLSDIGDFIYAGFYGDKAWLLFKSNLPPFSLFQNIPSDYRCDSPYPGVQVQSSLGIFNPGIATDLDITEDHFFTFPDALFALLNENRIDSHDFLEMCFNEGLLDDLDSAQKAAAAGVPVLDILA